MKTNCTPYCSGLFLILLFAFASCKSEKGSVPDPLFLKCWTNAFEEEGPDNVRIFRPCLTHTFPVTRYRNTFTLNENSVAEYSVLAPNDAHTTNKGSWSYDPQTKKLLISTKEKAVVHEYEVLEINEDLLRLKE